ncbi:MAG TPA: hypothetical protein PKH37_03045 [Alphaproteobacteria bacterium]|nr:hypothetical protein [Alphaproteobacteria bacterium]
MNNLLKFLSVFCLVPLPAFAAPLSFTVNMSEAVTVDTSGGTPRIAVDVGGVTRYAGYTSGSGSSALTFNYTPQAGDVDLDGVSLTSPLDLNGGTVTDLNGNAISNLTFTPPNTANVKVNYPSLGMDFVYDADGRYTLNGTAYNDLSSFLTAAGGSFTRNSIATYYDAAGTLQTASANTPRFDHDPVTHAPKGILIEESRTNIGLQSSNFSNASWLVVRASIVSNAAMAPDGTNTASKLVEDTTVNNTHYVRYPNDSNLVSGNIYTFSVFVKAAERSTVALIHYGVAGTEATFNLQTGVITGSNYAVSGTKIQNIGGGWYRISMTHVYAGAGLSFGVFIAQTNGTTAYTGDGTSGIYIWGAQLEQGSFPTSYIPTTNAAVTRAADSLTMPTGAWYDQNAGAVFADVSWESVFGPISWPLLWQFSDGTSNNRWNLYYYQGGGNLGVDAFTGGVSQGGFNNPVSASGSIRSGAAQSLNNANASYNGVLKTLDTSWAPPPVNQLRLGAGTSTRKWISKFKYYPARVADTQLQLLTQ